jgi:hypothetical protein
MTVTPRLWTAEDFADHSNVPRGTLSDFTQWYALLRKWNARINLVAPKEIEQFWHRHAYDSWQLNAYLPEKWERLVDLGYRLVYIRNYGVTGMCTSLNLLGKKQVSSKP